MARQRRGRAGGNVHGALAVANDADAREDESTLRTEESVLEFLTKSMRTREHWRPSKALARCLGVPYARVLLSTRKEDTVNGVWATVLALSCCATRLAEHHEAWYELADVAVAWLHRQPHYVEHREDLVRSACALLGLRDESALLATLFAEPKSAEQRALEAALGDWKQCYLQEPPYSLYYWNERTNHSTWRDPLETAKQQQEALERQQRRAALLAKVLPQRLAINRDARRPESVVHCGRCPQQSPREASVLCLHCTSSSGSSTSSGAYYCDECCDDVHCVRTMLSHSATGFRFRECAGKCGFPPSTVQRGDDGSVTQRPSVVATPDVATATTRTMTTSVGAAAGIDTQSNEVTTSS